MKKIMIIWLVGCSTSQPAKTILPTQHTVQSGETLFSIATNYYFEEQIPKGIKAIFKANPQIGKTGRIQYPLVVTIPKLDNNLEK